PGAGDEGGEVAASGTPKQIIRNGKSLTGRYLSGKEFVSVPSERRQADDRCIEIIGAEENNLKNVNAALPIGLMTVLSGVAGSGKSTLANETAYQSLAKPLYTGKYRPGKHETITGLEYSDKVIDINQPPIRRTLRANPAT